MISLLELLSTALRRLFATTKRIPDGTFDPDKLRDSLNRVEPLGFHSAWTQEAVLGSAPALAPLELMSFAAACNKRLRLGCAVFVSPQRGAERLSPFFVVLPTQKRGT